jgi:hypothetical protein
MCNHLISHALNLLVAQQADAVLVFEFANIGLRLARHGERHGGGCGDDFMYSSSVWLGPNLSVMIQIPLSYFSAEKAAINSSS